MEPASDTTSFERVALDELQNPAVRLGVTHWESLKGSRRFPARRELHPRDIVPILKNLLLVRVLDGGADFEIRIAGDVQLQTYAIPIAGKRLSELEDTSPAYGYVIRGLFGHVAGFGEPVALRGHFAPGFANVMIGYCETAMLPLGEAETVDHVLGFTAFVGNAA